MNNNNNNNSSNNNSMPLMGQVPEEAVALLQVTGAKPAEKIRAPGSFRSPHIGQLLAMRARFKRQADKLHRAASAEGTGSTDTELISAHKGSRVSVGMLNSGHLQAMYMRHI